jgi:hypothetical protein
MREMIVIVIPATGQRVLGDVIVSIVVARRDNSSVNGGGDEMGEGEEGGTSEWGEGPHEE